MSNWTLSNREAAGFYTAIFKNSKVKNVATLSNTPSGNVDILTIMLMDQEFMLISAGPFFKFNPSVSTEAFLKMKKFDIAKLKEASD